MSDSSLLQPVILSGGSGTRLWPVSRESLPKQLLPLVGTDSLLQSTLKRLEGFAGPARLASAPIVVSNEDHRFLIAEQLRTLGIPAWELILEPAGRNTAPALTVAAMVASAKGDDPLLLVMPADHLIRNVAAFQAALGEGIPHAQRGAVVTFGIVPDRPETGYGYIRMGGPLAANDTAPTRRLDAFFEKPDLATAQTYLADGRYLWNSGLFLLRASVWLSALERLRPDMRAACSRAVDGAKRDGDFFRLDAQAFLSSPADSIDYAVMEKVATLRGPEVESVVVPLDAGWSDIGAWDALWQTIDRDSNGNALRGDVIAEDTRNSLVIAESRLVACIGCDDLIVAETPDAVLVVRKDRAQDVKKVVDRLKAAGRSQAGIHRKVYRPWGWYDGIDQGERFQVKRIVVKPGGRTSLQTHHHRAEHWVVVRGTARVTRGDEVLLVTENQSVYVPLGTAHRLENPGKLPLELIEVQSGAYLGEDDIVRIEDQYGRVDSTEKKS